MHIAIKKGNKDQVDKLLKNSKKFIDYQGINPWITPSLLHALYRGDLAIVKLLLSYNPDITHLDGDGYSFFHYCVASGGLETKAKVDILKDLIQRAESSGHTGMISKADVWGNTTPLSTAIENNSDPLELVQLLLPYYRDKINQKPYLTMAVFKDQFEVASLLLEEGAEINSQQYYHGYPLLYWAVFRGNLEMTRLIFEHNTGPNEVNAKYENGITILHFATENLYLEIMEFLLSQKKIELEIQDDQGHTPLNIAIESGYYEGAKLLIHSGAQINLIETSKILSGEGPHFDKLRQHLLYVFIKNKNLDSLQLLLNSPFDLRLTTINEEFGKSPIMYAKEIDPKILQMIYRLTLNKSNRNGNYSN
ncbi:ankyrin repeat domain-containing protein [Candidatus Protochlamydia amoebophila]|uniref:Uncharacterized protein n=1 Tax=Candidatus Protochlamydia amoebophila TaxID=362787 RepID=A0A0C1H8C5_9BACT|nr:ankyrin repeat domain-containing protein [Candidatus Protochlamydia amoebophila]KIC71108.1 hypothetical protein DB44_ER00370 [Candidatus Protochlamydia amoebophila]